MKKLFNKLNFICKDCSIFYNMSFLLLGNIFLPCLISSLGFIFNISIGYFTYIISEIVLLTIYFLLFYNKEHSKKFWLSLIITFGIVVGSILITTFIFDNSVDGWGYHNPAIVKLSEGWNPLYEHFDDENILGLWSEHYPKIIWLYGASLYKLTNLFFVGSSFNLILSMATFFLLIDIFRKRKLNNVLATLFAFLITFNTINVSQLFTLYNDGVFGLCIISLLILFDSIFRKEYKFNLGTILLIAFYLSILANIKFNGALYALIIVVIYSIILLFKKIIKFDKNIVAYITIIGVCVLSIASNTYLTNYIHHSNIGYPILGDGKIDIITPYIPGYINHDDGKIKQFVKSITSSVNYEYQYKPFYISSSIEYLCASSSDCRINGFGPLYHTIIILTGILVLIYLAVLFYKLLKKEISLKEYINNNYFKFIPFLIMAAFFFIAPSTWWVRYVPYMHIVPLLLLIYFNDNWKQFNFTNSLVFGMIYIYIISFYGIFSNMLKQNLEFTNYINSEIKYIKNYDDNLHIAPIDVTTINNAYMQRMTYKYLENQDIEYKKHELGECEIIKNMDSLAISIVKCGDKDVKKD